MKLHSSLLTSNSSSQTRSDNMRRPVLCVASEVPKLADVLKERCSHICQKVTVVNPRAVLAGDDAILREAEVIVSEPHHAKLWIDKLPNLKFVQGTWAGVDR